MKRFHLLNQSDCVMFMTTKFEVEQLSDVGSAQALQALLRRKASGKASKGNTIIRAFAIFSYSDEPSLRVIRGISFREFFQLVCVAACRHAYTKQYKLN